jgi:hypothetical protein
LIKWIKQLRDIDYVHHACNILYLFYPGYKETKNKVLEIDPYDTKEYVCKDCDVEPFYVKTVYELHKENFHPEK